MSNVCFYWKTFWSFWQENVTYIAPVILSVAALAACCSTLFSFLAVRTNERLTEARILFEFKARYNEREMGIALKELSEFKKKYGGRTVEKWVSLRKSKSRQWQKLESYRRHVSGYYTDICYLFNGKFISEKLVRILLLERGVNVFVHIVEPIERSFISGWDFTIYDKLKSLRMHDRTFTPY